ncbi:hypothetical protein GCM10009104_03500 [Marinobacterium maritimum]|uniref:NADPH--hemoprotein reductase n=1 Tax=Marinobacterium maritimum TaxID=500162 RepID=A0ABP3T875_9GAMM
MRTYLLQVHRWLALLLTPLFLLIVLTGMVLALKPVVADLTAAPYAGPVAVSDLVALLNAQPDSLSVVGVERSSTQGQWILPGSGEFRLADGARVGSGADAVGNFFAWVKSLHKDLLMGAGWLVEWVTYAMVAIMVAGVLLGWPKFRHSLIGWHQWLGVWLLPLAIMLPLTAVLMSLHIGRPDLGLQRGAEPTLLERGLQQAAAEHNLSELVSARRFKAGSVLIQTQSQALVVSGDQITAIDVASNLPKQLHEGLWAGWISGVFNILVGGLVLGLTLSGGLSWWRRQRAAGASQIKDGAQVLVVFASQTGTAQGLATATAGSLEAAGIAVDQGSIAAFSPADWRRYRQVLVIASTTGEGELPEMARGWVKHLRPEALSGVPFSLLALGDRRYEHFCAGGHQLGETLLAAGAAEQLPLHEVDGDPAGEWTVWLQQLANLHGWVLKAEGVAPQRQRCQARLIERVRLDAEMGDDSPQSYSLIFEVPDEVMFEPGDLFQFLPGADAAPRTYSVGSAAAVTPGRIRLTVGLLRYLDDQGNEVLGLGSRELCLNWPLGEAREIELVAHPGFNPPQDSEQPLIMVATGCGIAPFIGFLEARAAAGRTGPVWLLFGNRHYEGDYLYRVQIETLVEQKVISELDTVFSRDGGPQRYITERLEQCGDKLLEWVSRGASLYICGRASTLGKGIDEVLVRLLQGQGMTLDGAQAELARWSERGVMHRDLFD